VSEKIGVAVASSGEKNNNSDCDQMAKDAFRLIWKRLAVENTERDVERVKLALEWKLDLFAHVDKYKDVYAEKEIA